MESLCWLTATDIERHYRVGMVQPEQVVASIAQRMDACEPKLNAVYLRKDFDATASAIESAKRHRAGRPLSPLDGVSVTLKENIFTQGDPAPIGTAASSLSPKQVNSPLADRLFEAGAILIAKTTMPDFGMLTSGVSSFHGLTRNPWRTDRNPGGSSSGAAAACAAGYGPLHIGTDIGGSIRLPAHFCGIYGLKPSLGRVPIHPPYAGRVAGPMTRTVRDAAMLMNVIARSDPGHRDFMNLPADTTDYVAALEQFDLKGKRIGLWLDSPFPRGVDPEIRAAVEACAQALAAEGAEIVPLRPWFSTDLLDGLCAFFEVRSYSEIIQLPAEAQAKILPFILRWARHRAPDFSGVDLMGFLNRIQELRERTVKATHTFDFLLSPVCPVPAYEAEHCCPGNDPQRALEHIVFTAPYNVSEQPAASINWGYAERGLHEGLPLGVQVAGRRFDDLGVLQLSRMIERLRPEQRPWPILIR